MITLKIRDAMLCAVLIFLVVGSLVLLSGCASPDRVFGDQRFLQEVGR